ncbi:MAG: hypothetical protein WKG07_12310 [Hymenobacter sp.]
MSVTASAAPAMVLTAKFSRTVGGGVALDEGQQGGVEVQARAVEGGQVPAHAQAAAVGGHHAAGAGFGLGVQAGQQFGGVGGVELAQGLQGRAGDGVAANFIARKPGFVQQRHAQAGPAQGQGAGRARRAGAENGNIVGFGHGAIRINA